MLRGGCAKKRAAEKVEKKIFFNFFYILFIFFNVKIGLIDGLNIEMLLNIFEEEEIEIKNKSEKLVIIKINTVKISHGKSKSHCTRLARKREREQHLEGMKGRRGRTQILMIQRVVRCVQIEWRRGRGRRVRYGLSWRRRARVRHGLIGLFVRLTKIDVRLSHLQPVVLLVHRAKVLILLKQIGPVAIQIAIVMLAIVGCVVAAELLLFDEEEDDEDVLDWCCWCMPKAAVSFDGLVELTMFLGAISPLLPKSAFTSLLLSAKLSNESF
ncbi:hypothetical protein BpHYR1_042637 [Brachionus plicatilis]|uniref:Uncharacterized protein n=1 Tax=Brachionus plicatilis TaxID=10195 RepID=A0A3M7T7Y8_BRAPC|nr:hypothetical protein BpHYR1_042637 [Brachionus plicatilis]